MMEVKVWVEGIPRVVCGVSDNTTCQDIVLALAHATGKTGRFTLVEKWRDNERLLAPVDCPLKVLHKWGEYSSDVQFILKHSDKDKKKQSSGRRKKDKPADTADGRPSSTAIKKAFTFSGVHARSAPGLQNGHSLVNHSHQNSLPNGYLDNSDCGSDIASKQHGWSLQENTVTAFQPNQTLNLLHLDSPKQPKVSQDLGVSQNAVNQNKGLAKEKISNSKDGVVPDLKSKENGSCQTVITSPGERTVDGSGPDDTVRQEMVQLVSLQKNRIKDQEGRLRELEDELSYWEKCEGENNRQAQDVENQIKSLEKSEMDINDQLQELELVSWVDKVEMAKSTKTALQRDLAGLKQQLQKVESELKCKQTRIKEMTQNIAVELESIKKKQGEMKENVEKDIEVIKKELYDKCTKEKETQATISKIEDELKENQVTITEKKLQIADIEKEIKEVNLENFTHAPNLLNTEGCGEKPFNKQRPGSARRLPGSPQKLGDAVPTAKNPQGLWV